MNQFTHLIEVCLDQRNPSPALVAALNDLLTLMQHPARLTEVA